MKMTIGQILDKVSLLTTKMHYGVQNGNNNALKEYLEFCKKEVEIDEDKQ